jgi:hypothetical protein
MDGIMLLLEKPLFVKAYFYNVIPASATNISLPDSIKAVLSMIYYAGFS